MGTLLRRACVESVLVICTGCAAGGGGAGGGGAGPTVPASPPSDVQTVSPSDLAPMDAGGVLAVPDGSVFAPTFGALLGPTVQAATPPPPISGGTLLVTHDGAYAVASDPDRDRIDVVDLNAHTLAATLSLQPGDEPGRVVEDGHRCIHIALR